MDAVVAAIHARRDAPGRGKEKRKETLADRVEKAVGITMTEEEKANIERERREAAMYWPVCLNPKTKPSGCAVSEDRMSFTSTKGYRTCAASHGVKSGSFYFEITIARLGKTGHARVGWKSKKGERIAPWPGSISLDLYGYKDIRGEKVHEGVTEAYGEAFVEGDVIGCYIFVEAKRKGDLKKEIDGRAEETFRARSPFARNGKFQGKAYVGLNNEEARIFPRVRYSPNPMLNRPSWRSISDRISNIRPAPQGDQDVQLLHQAATDVQFRSPAPTSRGQGRTEDRTDGRGRVGAFGTAPARVDASEA